MKQVNGMFNDRSTIFTKRQEEAAARRETWRSLGVCAVFLLLLAGTVCVAAYVRTTHEVTAADAAP